MYNNYLLTNNVVLKKALYCIYVQFMYLISGLRLRKGMSRGGGEIMTVIMHLMAEQ